MLSYDAAVYTDVYTESIKSCIYFIMNYIINTEDSMNLSNFLLANELLMLLFRHLGPSFDFDSGHVIFIFQKAN